MWHVTTVGVQGQREKPQRKKNSGNKVVSSYFRELLSLEISRTPFLTWTYKRIIGTDAEMEKKKNSHLGCSHNSHRCANSTNHTG